MHIKKKTSNYTSEIRLSGVPPIMPLKHQKPKKKTKGKIDPHKYVLQGPPILPIKTNKTKRKKNVKIDPLKYVFQGSTQKKTSK